MKKNDQNVYFLFKSLNWRWSFLSFLSYVYSLLATFFGALTNTLRVRTDMFIWITVKKDDKQKRSKSFELRESVLIVVR